MGTRSNILVSDTNGNKLWIYRHWDGYASETGVDIAQTLKKLKKNYSQEFAGLVNALLAKRYGQEPHEKAPRRIYEVTEGEHGDIEWKYEIRFTKKGAVIKVSEFGWKNDEWVTTSFTEKQFRAYCAKELAEARKRIQDIKRKRAA